MFIETYLDSLPEDTKEINVFGKGIKNLDVSRFKNLKKLNCSNNLLTSLHLNENLQTLYCSNNLLTSLQLNENLQTLYCNNNLLTSLQLNKNIPSATCNVRYVYDSSDYITYLKQKAVVQNYNDLTYGGDQSNASQSTLRAVRRY